MKILLAVDWSDEAFAAVQQALSLYKPTDVVIVHGIDIGVFEYPSLAQLASLQGYEEFRRAVITAGEELLTRTAGLVSSSVDAVTRINQIGNPARVILQAANDANADLVVLGARGRSRLAEVVLGSVSHRVLMHSPCTTLIVRGGSRPVKRVLVAVEGKEDGARIVQWLRDHPFKDPVELSILSVVVPLKIDDPSLATGLQSWMAEAKASAEDVVKSVAAALRHSADTVHTRVTTGDVAPTVASEAQGMDLIVTATHGRHGLERLLLGSVSHAIVHRAQVPVLIIH